MDKLPFVIAEDVKGEERIPKRVSKLLLAPKTIGTRNVSMGLNVTAVGSMIPDHVHEDFITRHLCSRGLETCFFASKRSLHC